MDTVHTNVSVLSGSCSFSLPSSSFLRMVNGKCFALLVYLYRMLTHTALELKRKPRACLSLVFSMKSRGEGEKERKGRGKKSMANSGHHQRQRWPFSLSLPHLPSFSLDFFFFVLSMSPASSSSSPLVQCLPPLQPLNTLVCTNWLLSESGRLFWHCRPFLVSIFSLLLLLLFLSLLLLINSWPHLHKTQH